MKVTPAYQVRTILQLGDGRGGLYVARQAEYDPDAYEVLAVDEDAVVVRNVHLATSIGSQVDAEPVAGVYIEGDATDTEYATYMLREAGLDPARYAIDSAGIYDAGSFIARAEDAE